MMKKLIALFLVTVYLFMMSGCSASSSNPTGGNSRTYNCDYHTLSLKTKITTTINGEEVAITGKLFTFFTDPLKMTNSKGQVIASADDSYHIINQDDHNIVVNGNFEVCVAGNIDFIGESYKLYNKDGNRIGSADFGAFGCSGEICDMNGKVAAEFSCPPLFNDYTVIIYDNDICSDTAMLLIVASYVSDYHYDNS